MTVVLVDPRRPSLIPVEAIEFLAGDVQYTEEMPVKVPWSLPSARPAYEGDDAPTLLSSDRDHPAVKSRLAAGDKLIAAPDPQAGERLVDAVAMMDKLRTTGPWESEQTHDSLRRFLLEETYELFDAVRSGNADELREELGDVLLQVLFQARIAEDAPQHAFTIDDVADALQRKLANRVPAVLAGEAISLEDQIAQWEERKAPGEEVTQFDLRRCADGSARVGVGAEGDRPGEPDGPARGSDPCIDDGCDGVVGRRCRKRPARHGFGVHGHRAHCGEGDRRRPSG